MDDLYDVVIVGYGPVGQALSAMLGRAGHRVQVLERHTGLYQMSRAGQVDHEIMRILQSLGLADGLETKFSSAGPMTLQDANLEELSRFPPTATRVSGWRQSYHIYQPVLEVAVDNLVQSLPNVELLRGREVERVEPHDDHVEVFSRPFAVDGTTGGETRSVKARFVVGADGANSIVRRSAGLEWEDLGYTGPWLVCDFEHHDPTVALPFMGSFVCDPARPAMAGRWLGRNHSRVEFMVLPGENPEDFDNEDVCWELAKRFGMTPETSKLARHTVYTFRSLLAETWRAGRLLLAGDAGHVMPPFMGQGMCSGYRDAANLSWKLDLVLRGEASDRLLDHYTEERKPHVAEITRVSMAFGQIVSTLDPTEAAERDERLRGSPPPSADVIPGLAAGVLSSTYSDPAVGQLGLQAVIEFEGRQGRLDDVIGNGWQVVSRRRIDLNALTAAQGGVLRRIGAKVVSTCPATSSGMARDVNLDYEEWLGSMKADLVIVRPDHYTYAVVGDVHELGAALEELGRDLQLT